MKKNVLYQRIHKKNLKEFSDTAQNFGLVCTSLEEFENGARERIKCFLRPRYAEGEFKNTLITGYFEEN